MRRELLAWRGVFTLTGKGNFSVCVHLSPSILTRPPNPLSLFPHDVLFQSLTPSSLSLTFSLFFSFPLWRTWKTNFPLLTEKCEHTILQFIDLSYPYRSVCTSLFVPPCLFHILQCLNCVKKSRESQKGRFLNLSEIFKITFVTVFK